MVQELKQEAFEWGVILLVGLAIKRILSLYVGCFRLHVLEDRNKLLVKLVHQVLSLDQGMARRVALKYTLLLVYLVWLH